MSAGRLARGTTCLLAIPPALLAAQSPAGDSLRLGALHAEAAGTDPRRRELPLLAAQTALRLRSIGAERFPALAGEGSAQYQSDVVRLPIQLPGGQRVPSPAHDSYDAHVSAQQSLVDPTLAPRRAVERAQLAESRARVAATLFATRQEVNESFFAAAALQARLAELRASLAGLEARRREAAARVREGVALPGDVAAIDATILQRRQDEARLHAERRAALARLESLTGRAIAEDAVVATPDLGAEAARARTALATLRARPEYEQFARTRDLLARQAEVVAAGERPHVSAFGRAGYGRPGLNLLANRFDSYWLTGVAVRWRPWTWGTARRERETLALQQRIVAAHEAAFTESLRRAVQGDVAAIDRLAVTLAADERIITLREQIERETRARFQEGVVTAAAYLDRSTELLQARLALAAHRVELAQVQARLLTTLGLEVR